MSINSELKCFLSISFPGHKVIYLILRGVYFVSSFLYRDLACSDLSGKAGGASTGSFQCVGAGCSNTFWLHSLPQPPGPRQVGWGCTHSGNPFTVTTEGEVCLPQGPTVSH